MRKLKPAAVTEAVREMCIKAAHELPRDMICAIKKSVKQEKGISARILDFCLKNAQIAKDELIPLCQDTGVAVVFAEIGNDLFVEGDINAAIEEGVRQGYEQGYLRKSIVADPLFTRKNTDDNTPAIIHYSFTKGDKLKLTVMLKGGGSENNSKINMFAPSATIADIEDFVLKTVAAAGSKSCPPLIVGIGIGGNFEDCALLAKKSLAREIGSKNKDKRYDAFEKQLLKKINALNIGPQGLGGKTTALAAFVEFAPCHMASLPVAVNLGCHANRHVGKVL